MAGWIELSVPRLGASSDADSVGRTSEDEVASWMWIFEIDDVELDGNCAHGEIMSVSVQLSYKGQAGHDAW